MKMLYIPTILMSCLMLQACNAGPNPSRPASPPPQAIKAAAAPVEAISNADIDYAARLKALESRNPAAEAQQAAMRGERNLMGYYSGRAGLKIPSLSDPSQKGACSVKTLDGMGDVIYNEAHLRYRVAMRNFAKAFNASMLPHCR
jgi:hypothetical protein